MALAAKGTTTEAWRPQPAKGNTKPLTPDPPTAPRPMNQSLLRHFFCTWQPERPELLFRLRPRPTGISHGSH